MLIVQKAAGAYAGSSLTAANVVGRLPKDNGKMKVSGVRFSPSAGTEVARPKKETPSPAGRPRGLLSQRSWSVSYVMRSYDCARVKAGNDAHCLRTSSARREKDSVLPQIIPDALHSVDICKFGNGARGHLKNGVN